MLFLLSALGFMLGSASGCSSIAAYEASHPPYKFPVSGCCGGGGNGG
ncbi:MAG: hypothetical protein WDN25_26325 [Acetobacteraceae bacterium]